MRHLLATFFIALAFVALTQDRIEYIPSSEIYEEAMEANMKGDYDKAYNLFMKIHENDTAYFDALVGAGSSASELDHYDTCRMVYEKGLASKLFNPERATFYNNLIHAYIQLENYDKALEIVTSALEEYPRYYLLHYNHSSILMELKKYDEALIAAQTCVRYNPRYLWGHVRISELCHRAGDLTKAALALNAASVYGALESAGVGVVVRLQSLYNDEKPEEGSIKLNYPEEESFTEIDELISNQLAKNKQYKVKNKLGYDFIKTNHLVLEKIAYDPNDKGFFNQNYVRFFKDVFTQGKFEMWSYYQCAGIDEAKTQKLLKKKMPKLKEFYGWMDATYTEYMNDRMILENGTYVKNRLKHNVSFGFDEEFDEVDGKPSGQYIGYQDNFIASKGQYDSNVKQDGTWEYYHQGILSIRVDLKAGELEGERIEFYKNGAKERILNFKDGKITGTIINFYKSGMKLNEVPLNDEGNEEGQVKYYHTNGQLKFDITFVNGKKEGKFLEYYDNGQMAADMNYKDDKLDGEYKVYHRNGQLRIDGNYKADERDGDWKYYYADGKLKEEGKYVNGDYAGVWNSFHRNGNKDEVVTYGENGKRKGVYNEYNEAGELVLEYEYKGEEIISYKSFGKDGKVLSEKTKTKKELDFERFHENGNISVRGQFYKDYAVGEWSYYNYYGQIKSTKNFNDEGELEGVYITYFDNGELDSKSNYKDGMLDGYYEEYYQNGQMYCQGNFEDDQRVGLWAYYWKDGSLKSEYYYINGEVVGMVKTYDEKGVLNEEIQYYEDFFEKLYAYDSKGNMYNLQTLELGTGKITFTDANDELSQQTEYLGGEKNGEEIGYFDNGKVRFRGSYLNGNMEGKWTYYDRFGNVTSEGNFVNGEQDGMWKYYDNGKLTLESTYDNGVLNGDRIWYYTNGKVEQKRPYYYGARHGETVYYDALGKVRYFKYHNYGEYLGYAESDASGKPKAMIAYGGVNSTFEPKFSNGKTAVKYTEKDGEIEGELISYHSNGQIKEQSNYKAGEFDGEFKEFYVSGHKKQEGTYKSDLKHGTFKKYYSNGKLRSVETYFMGELYGPAEYYDKNGRLIEKLEFYNARKI